MPTANSAATLLAALQLVEHLERLEERFKSDLDGFYPEAHLRAVQEARLALKAYATGKP